MTKRSVWLSTFLFSALPIAAQDSPWLAEFTKHWQISKEFTLAVADKMPEDSYAFKPNPEEMGFGELMAHIAQAQSNAFARASGGTSPLQKPEKLEKAAVMKYMADSFDYCAKVLAAVRPAQLDQMIGAAGRQSSVREVFWHYFTHTAHHRGQAEVYLRVKGIKPPDWRF